MCIRDSINAEYGGDIYFTGTVMRRSTFLLQVPLRNRKVFSVVWRANSCCILPFNSRTYVRNLGSRYKKTSQPPGASDQKQGTPKQTEKDQINDTTPDPTDVHPHIWTMLKKMKGKLKAKMRYERDSEIKNLEHRLGREIRTSKWVSWSVVVVTALISGFLLYHNFGKKSADDEDNVCVHFDSLQIPRDQLRMHLDDVIGLESPKQALNDAVIFPLQYPHLYDSKRKPWKGILLYGPPGTGKSMLAEATANYLPNCSFFSMSASDLVSKYYGESEKLVRALFETAREKAPSIIFIDEIDSIGGDRDSDTKPFERRILTELLIQMDGVSSKSSKQVLVLAATNTPWALDPGIRRRFEKRVYVSLPTESERNLLLKYHLGKSTIHTLKERDFEELAKRTEGYSGADISIICREALLEPLRQLQKGYKFKWVKMSYSEIEKEMKYLESRRGEAKDKTEEKGSSENERKLKNLLKKWKIGKEGWMTGSVLNNFKKPENGEIKEEKQEIKLIWEGKDVTFRKLVVAEEKENANEAEWCWKISLQDIEEQFRHKVTMPPTTIDHFEKAMKSIRPSVSQSDVSRYSAWAKDYGSG
eukprot:TRINITY_DN4443_c0_g1_i2.p1 TRINITY_DN4443_c0_g1~~TRINITY_DN4443_c0_g1_i2.p1  ORF type:complete len:588 (-),score=141.67 TRINITY_DN4443_c0_g1_i2:4-1767(-)